MLEPKWNLLFFCKVIGAGGAVVPFRIFQTGSVPQGEILTAHLFTIHCWIKKQSLLFPENSHIRQRREQREGVISTLVCTFPHCLQQSRFPEKKGVL